MIKVRRAATCICLRPRTPSPVVLRAEDARHLGGECGQWITKDLHFTNDLEVLLGQSEVVNWMRSPLPGPLKSMRYPGEFRFPGGRIDGEETAEMAAKRELREEFLLDVTPILQPYIELQTRPIEGMRYIMHNFLCHVQANPWLEGDIEKQINQALRQKRLAFEALLDWTTPTVELSPEVRCVQWFTISDAVHECLTSGAATFIPVNDFQASEFRRLGITQRDPMQQTMKALIELPNFHPQQRM
eukprot:GEMP01057908.1.p1 GENE.GEMP01057908.1~~GEMP01057908.1.p1  ORF type:complete len:244 (+),score=46.51 GEMP01057908.1:83-814(+)